MTPNFRFKSMIQIFSLFTLTVCFCTLSCNVPETVQSPEQQVDPEITRRVKDVMKNLTLEDKVGEMTQLAINMVSKGQGYNVVQPHQLDSAKLKHVLVDLKVGSILNVGSHAYSREHWHHIIKTIQDIAVRDKPSGIPVLYGIDAIHGNNYTMNSTLFPQEIAMAASWNPELVMKISEVTAYETQASWIPWTFAPVLDIGRDPRWPRFWETFGEDVHLANELGQAFIVGVQGDSLNSPYTIASCLKHFLGYSGPFSGKDRSQAIIPERQLREYYLPTFKKAIEAGAMTVMINSGEINGIPVHCDKRILTDLLRNELGFKGIAVTDWNDLNNLHARHKVAKDYKEAIKLSINAGIDMAMVPMDLEFTVLLKELVEEGEVPMSRIDESVERILTVKLLLGLFENPYPESIDYSDFNSDEHNRLSLSAALESIILAKNEGSVLPLSKNSKVLIAGPTANTMMSLNGGWNRTWQGNHPVFDAEQDQMTVLEAVENKIGKNNVIYVEGTTYDQDINMNQAEIAARYVDAALICLGEMTYTETPGDIDDLHLPPVQYELVEEIAAAGKPVILVLIEGRPRLVNSIEPISQAVLIANLPGNQGGNALAEIIFGDHNPEGKLPYTYPRFANSLMTYDHRLTDEIGPRGFYPQWEFGHGLSYTRFEYANLQLSSNELSADGSIDVSIQVSNTGGRGGNEVVQLYVKDLVASITPPVKKLRAFKKMFLDSGESATVDFSISVEDLKFVGSDNQWITEPGRFEIYVGNIKAEFVLK